MEELSHNKEKILQKETILCMMKEKTEEYYVGNSDSDSEEYYNDSEFFDEWLDCEEYLNNLDSKSLEMRDARKARLWGKYMEESGANGDSGAINWKRSLKIVERL